MEINNMTNKQSKKLIKRLAKELTAARPQAITPHIGKKCIIRTYASGVHYGELVDQQGRQVELIKARRIWLWRVKNNDGISLSEVATYGLDDSDKRVCVTLPAISLLDALEIIPCAHEAISSIENSAVYTP